MCVDGTRFGTLEYWLEGLLFFQETNISSASASSDAVIRCLCSRLRNPSLLIDMDLHHHFPSTLTIGSRFRALSFGLG